MSKKQPKMQFCIGEYEPDDPICNGNSDGSAYEQAACYWRNYCAAFKIHLKEIGLGVEDFVTIEVVTDSGDEEHLARPKNGYNEFVALLDGVIKDYGITEGVATKKPTEKAHRASAKPGDKRKKHAPKRSVQRKAKKALAKLAAEKRAKMKDMFEWFRTHLIESLEGGYTFSTPGQAPLPGKLYIVDRTEKSGYISIYCKSPKGVDVPIALVIYKTRQMKMDIRVPVEAIRYRGINQKTVQKLGPQPINDGLFKSTMRNLDKEGVALAAQTIAQLAKSGIIDLPQAG